MSVSMSILDSPRTSVFTFQSSVHSCHVLHCLDDQRRRDLLCDITVVVEGRSFRAHRSVLASCSDYFTHRVSTHATQGLVITLPEEVSEKGFEPLLDFAYTSKLLFSKNNIMEIRQCASTLGFRDLDSACFDFLLPKFFRSSSPALIQRKTCCKTLCRKRSPRAEDLRADVLVDDKDLKAVSDLPVEQGVGSGPHQSRQHSIDKTGSKSEKPDPAPEGAIQSDIQTDYSLQCPKYRKFQLACGKERMCLEVCRPEINPDCPVLIEKCCPLTQPPARFRSSLPCSSGGVCGQTTGDNSYAPSQTPSNQPGEGQEESRGQEEKKSEVAVERRGEDEERKERNDGKKNWDEGKREAGEGNVDWSDRTRDWDSAVDCIRSFLPVDVVSHSGSNSCQETLGEGTIGTEPHRCPLGPGLDFQGLGGLGGGDCVSGGRGIDPDAFISSQPHAVQKQVRRDGTEVERHKQQGGRQSGVGEWRGSEWEERSSVEREVAEHLAHVASLPLPLDSPPGREMDAQGLQGRRPTMNWLNQLDLKSTPGHCPFLHDLDGETDRETGSGTDSGTGQGEAHLLGCVASSYSEKSPCLSSLNSGDDGDSEGFDTEGDSETCSYSQRAKEVQLPFSVGRVLGLSRNDFQLMLRHHPLTREQLDFVQDVRRRSKNRIAAQRCRKRKLDCIHNLECEINKLRAEKDNLMSERTHLSQMKQNAWHSVSALCQRVCSEAALRPEQLQVLAKYTSTDCPLSALISPTEPASPGLGGLTQALASPSACCFLGPSSDTLEPQEPLASCSRDKPTGAELSGNWTSLQVQTCDQVTDDPAIEPCDQHRCRPEHVE
ncbi:transcription regulator protein BACH1b [Esox lucius]|uniref:BTB and CNC homology 1, basic leucine zipper transcription factor 1 b n=1 Tax=Esox lucius TaxID=8010 RepID=A0A3P8XYV7_ESOLU|nr:transcription regulator protein BACH1b [Esox lucius]